MRCIFMHTIPYFYQNGLNQNIHVIIINCTLQPIIISRIVYPAHYESFENLLGNNREISFEIAMVAFVIPSANQEVWHLQSHLRAGQVVQVVRRCGICNYTCVQDKWCRQSGGVASAITPACRTSGAGSQEVWHLQLHLRAGQVVQVVRRCGICNYTCVQDKWCRQSGGVASAITPACRTSDAGSQEVWHLQSHLRAGQVVQVVRRCGICNHTCVQNKW